MGSQSACDPTDDLGHCLVPSVTAHSQESWRQQQLTPFPTCADLRHHCQRLSKTLKQQSPDPIKEEVDITSRDLSEQSASLCFPRNLGTDQELLLLARTCQFSFTATSYSLTYLSETVVQKTTTYDSFCCCFWDKVTIPEPVWVCSGCVAWWLEGCVCSRDPSSYWAASFTRRWGLGFASLCLDMPCSVDIPGRAALYWKGTEGVWPGKVVDE